MVASYSSAQCVIYDLETAAPVVTLDSAKTYSEYACVLLPCSIHRLKCTVSGSLHLIRVKQSSRLWQIFVEAFHKILILRFYLREI